MQRAKCENRVCGHEAIVVIDIGRSKRNFSAQVGPSHVAAQIATFSDTASGLCIVEIEAATRDEEAEYADQPWGMKSR